MAARPAGAEEDLLEVRCAGCGETLEVERGLTEFACPDCATPQALPPELMPPPPPPRRRRAVPLPSAPARVAPPPARLPCGACGALLSVPPGLARCGCPVCGAELVVDPARVRQYLAAAAAPPLVPVAPPAVFQAREAQQEYPDSAVCVGHVQGYPNNRLFHAERSQIRCRNTEALSEYPDAHTDRDDIDTEVSDETNARHCHRSGFSVDSRTFDEKRRQVEALNHVVYQVHSQQSNYSVHAEGSGNTIHVGDAHNKYLNHAVHKKRQAQTLNQTTREVQKHSSCSIICAEHAMAPYHDQVIDLQETQVDPVNHGDNVHMHSKGNIREKPKRKGKQQQKRNVRGRGQTQGGQRKGKEIAGSSNGCPRTLKASGRGMGAAAEYDDDIDLFYFENNVECVREPVRASNDPPLVNYKSGGRDIKPLRYSEDPREVKRGFFGDNRFWFPSQADWYESVIMKMKTPTTEMKWIDWNFLKTLTPPVKAVVDAVYARCQEMDLLDIMSFRCDWNEEVVAQFYATLYIENGDHHIHWTTGGKRYKFNMTRFSELFGHKGDAMIHGSGYIVHRDRSKVDLHAGGEIEPSKMHFMYDRAYGDMIFGQVKGLTPYYKMLNTLFRFTLTPRIGDSDNISRRAKNLLFQMAPGQRKFTVMEFIWNEMLACSYDALSSCKYAPYIFHMIKHVTGLAIVPSKIHQPYRTVQGKLEQSLHLGTKHSTRREPKGPFPGAYPTNFNLGASSSLADPNAPSSSRARYHGALKKKSTLAAIAQGVFALFNLCKQNASEFHEYRKECMKDMLKMQKRQKEIMDKFELPHSPIQDHCSISSPPHFYNPWDEDEPLGEDVELEYGGEEIPSKKGDGEEVYESEGDGDGDKDGENEEEDDDETLDDEGGDDDDE